MQFWTPVRSVYGTEYWIYRCCDSPRLLATIYQIQTPPHTHRYMWVPPSPNQKWRCSDMHTTVMVVQTSTQYFDMSFWINTILDEGGTIKPELLRSACKLTISAMCLHRLILLISCYASNSRPAHHVMYFVHRKSFFNDISVFQPKTWHDFTGEQHADALLFSKSRACVYEKCQYKYLVLKSYLRVNQFEMKNNRQNLGNV